MSFIKSKHKVSKQNLSYILLVLNFLKTNNYVWPVFKSMRRELCNVEERIIKSRLKPSNKLYWSSIQRTSITLCLCVYYMKVWKKTSVVDFRVASTHTGRSNPMVDNPTSYGDNIIEGCCKSTTVTTKYDKHEISNVALTSETVWRSVWQPPWISQ